MTARRRSPGPAWGALVLLTAAAIASADGLMVPMASASTPLSVRPRAAAVPAAFSAKERPLLLIPQPKQVRLAEGHRAEKLTVRDGIECSVTLPQGEDHLPAALREVLSSAGITPRTVRRYFHAAPWAEVRLGSTARARTAPAEDAEWARNPEGYSLKIGADGVTLTGSTARGAFYGLQTLRQLLRPGADGAECPTGEILDWPTMPSRGAHWFPSASGVPFHRKLIERVMSRYKLNAAVIQCEAARWESHPEIAAPNSISRADLQGLVDLCRSRYLDPIPLINAPGHAQWMFRNDRNLELAEDPQTPYAYCVNHPEGRKFIREILTEAVEVFRPSWFHLGHDEVTLRGRFPNPECPRCAGRDVTDLVLGHARGMRDWLAERKVRMMIWGDMLLAPSESPDAHAPSETAARARRQGLPDDLRVADWHYETRDRYPSLDLLRQGGREVIACTWHDPQNVFTFARAARQAGAAGLLQTTWAGYFPDEKVLETESRQFAAFILAAEYAWSGRSEPPAELPYRHGTELARAYTEDGPPLDRAGTLLDLSRAARVTRAAWEKLGPAFDLRSLPAGKRRAADVLFQVPEKLLVLGGPASVAGASPGVTLELSRKAGEVALLNAAVRSVPPGTVAAKVTVEYADGAAETVELATGRSTAAWSDETALFRAPIGWQARAASGERGALRVTRWSNPHPERQIARLRFQPVHPEAGLILAGVTLLD